MKQYNIFIHHIVSVRMFDSVVCDEWRPLEKLSVKPSWKFKNTGNTEIWMFPRKMLLEHDLSVVSEDDLNKIDETSEPGFLKLKDENGSTKVKIYNPEDKRLYTYPLIIMELSNNRDVTIIFDSYGEMVNAANKIEKVIRCDLNDPTVKKDIELIHDDSAGHFRLNGGIGETIKYE